MAQATCHAMAPRVGKHRHAMGNIGTRGHLDMGKLARDGTPRWETLHMIGTRVIGNQYSSFTWATLAYDDAVR